MRALLTRNLGWKLLSLAAAVLLWIAVASEPELSTFVTAPVEYKNLPSTMEINSTAAESVVLEVRGPSEELRGLPGHEQRYAVILDLSNTEPGEHTYTLDRADVRLPRGIQFLRAIPAQIRLNVERFTSRSVRVDVRFAGELPPDLEVVETTPEPSSLTIAGPASRVARITSVETDPIPLRPEPGTHEYRADAFVSDGRVRFEDSPQVTVRVTVAPK